MSDHTIKVRYCCRKCGEVYSQPPPRCERCGGVRYEPLGRVQARQEATRQPTTVTRHGSMIVRDLRTDSETGFLYFVHMNAPDAVSYHCMLCSWKSHVQDGESYNGVVAIDEFRQHVKEQHKGNQTP